MKISSIIFVKGYKKNLKLNLNNQSFYENSVLFNNIEEITDWNFIKKNDKMKDLQYLTPSIITNAIIKYSHSSNLFISKLLYFFDELICKHIVVDFDLTCDLNNIKEFASKLNNSNINSCLMIFNFKNDFYCDEFGEIILSINKKVKAIIFHSPFNKNFDNIIHYFVFPRQNIYSKKLNEFQLNSLIYNESQKHHIYFNRKLYFGPSGELKNAPECEEIFGNINEINNLEELKQIISTPEFQKYWDVNKDIQDVCKDCEFRYMCVDNKIPFQRSENEWYHKMECNYNPYITKWEGEDGYKTLAECGVISNENGFSIDHDKIEEINKELWGE